MKRAIFILVAVMMAAGVMAEIHMKSIGVEINAENEPVLLADSNQDWVAGDVIGEYDNGNYYIIETAQWYFVVEWYSGLLDEGDRVFGDIKGYGSRYIKNVSRDCEVEIYIRDYFFTESSCLEWLDEHYKL